MSVVVAVAVAVDLDDDDECCCCCCCWNFDTLTMLTMLVLLLYLATKQLPSSNSTALGRANLEPLDLTSTLNRTVDIVVAAAGVFLFDSRNCYCLEDESYCSVVDLLLLFDSCFDSYIAAAVVVVVDQKQMKHNLLLWHRMATTIEVYSRAAANIEPDFVGVVCANFLAAI